MTDITWAGCGQGSAARAGISSTAAAGTYATQSPVRGAPVSRYKGRDANSGDRKPGQGGDADQKVRDLRAELLQAEAAHFAKTRGGDVAVGEGTGSLPKRELEAGGGGEEDLEAKRRRILEESRDVDADSEGEGDSDSSEEDSDDEDETAELQRELEKIKRERAEKREAEVGFENVGVLVRGWIG